MTVRDVYIFEVGLDSHRLLQLLNTADKLFLSADRSVPFLCGVLVLKFFQRRGSFAVLVFDLVVQERVAVSCKDLHFAQVALQFQRRLKYRRDGFRMLVAALYPLILAHSEELRIRKLALFSFIRRLT